MTKRNNHIFGLLVVFIAMTIAGYLLRNYFIGFVLFALGIVLAFVTLLVILLFHFSMPCPFCGYPVSTIPFKRNNVQFLRCPSCFRHIQNPYI